MGDDISLGLPSMAVCFDFPSTNVVQLSNWNPYNVHLSVSMSSPFNNPYYSTLEFRIDDSSE
jgi:hypothetical protein